MYEWPIVDIESKCDQPVQHLSEDQVRQALDRDGASASLIDFLTPLYASVDGATFERGSLRIYPLSGFKEHGAPTLTLWNKLNGWKQFEPPKLGDTFYFCSNVFGDLFGVPVTPDLEISRDRIGILWIERYEYQEAGVEWRTLFSSIFSSADYLNYFARVNKLTNLAHLRTPAPWQCFSSNVPPLLGGPNTVQNISIQSLVVHVSFTLQLLKQWKEGKIEPGAPLAMVDLYDDNGNLAQ
jgi:hypothetical protein